ncbi:hypothetical protein B1H10_05075 [candidate division KSB1 bacterium 4484_188]|nr:MAG: hypothetical protein B1H10_05075 [candidate division KSB1 bacterium 4484_188]
MSDCDKFKMQFSNYLDGELSAFQRKELDEHFSICPDCSQTIRQMKIIQQSLRQMPSFHTSPDFERRLHQHIFEPQHERAGVFPFPWQNWKLPAMGSALVLATLSLFLVFNPTDNNNTQISNQNKTMVPAATRLSGPNSFNSFQPSSVASGKNVSALHSDSLFDDSTQIDREGIQLVGKRK